MAITDKNTIYSWFQTDDFPTEDQFRATWDSFWHKSESIPMSSISGLNQLFQQTATVAQLNNKANVDGSNIDVSAYQEKLNITNLIATAKEEVKTELLNGAPKAFDTLKEISDWISDDETAEAAILQAIQNEATARTNADNQKLDKGNYTGTAQDLKNDIDNLSKTTDNVVATTTVGAINAGETVPVGTNIQALTELLLNKTFYPTFVNPTFGLTNNAGLREVGSSFSVTLTFNFNRGQILGRLDNGIWNPTMLQDYRAGIATSYLLNGVSGANNSASFNITTILGTNTLNGSVTYAEGVKPKDSKNNDFESPFPAGTSPIQSTSFEGIYPYFYYKSTSPITPAIMQSAIANGQATKVLASSTGTITIPFLPNGEYIAVAYPATSTTKTKWYINALDSGDIKPGSILGNETTLPCNSPTGLWNGINFKIHVSPGVLTQYEAVQLKNS